ncbi:MAG: hypothetical protein CML02_20175 [Pseudooceanicola sp.]|jgi:hypothetical protein|nr:hypothetical protein [Pseudooceanicola sp.]
MPKAALELIWTGAFKALPASETVRLRRVLGAMVPVRPVFLAASSGVDRIEVLPDELELMPALPLGDVIVEELGIDVPYGALLVACDTDTLPDMADPESLSFDLGLAIGQILLIVLRRGVFPLERENEALYIMACAFDRMARSSALCNMGLLPDGFSRGLVTALAGYWTGARIARADVTGLFRTPGCLAGEELRRYLRMLDPGFNAPEYQRIPGGLLAAPGGAKPFADWCERVEASVTSLMSPRTRNLIDG